MIVIVVHAENVRDSAFSIGPSGAGVQTLRSRSAREQRERIHNAVRAARPVQPKINVVLRTSSSSTTATTSAAPKRPKSRTVARPEVVDQPQNHGVGIALRGCYIVEVLARRRRHEDIWHGNIVQKRLCRQTD